MISMGQTHQNRLNKWRSSPYWRLSMMTLGWFLIVISPIVGALPGPGFVILFPIGLALILKNSRAAKKYYSRFGKRHPEYGRWLNWALRRAKSRKTPDFPPIKKDILYLFRRDDGGQKRP